MKKSFYYDTILLRKICKESSLKKYLYALAIAMNFILINNANAEDIDVHKSSVDLSQTGVQEQKINEEVKKENNSSKTNDKDIDFIKENIEQIAYQSPITPLKNEDYVIEDIQLGQPLKPEWLKAKDKIKIGEYEVLKHENIDYTIYVGQGSKFNLKNGSLVGMHITDKAFKTKRGVAVGDKREYAVLQYGSPQALWRDESNNSLIYMYSSPHEENSPILAFETKSGDITSIDVLFNRNINLRGLPKYQPRFFAKNKMLPEDFVLDGYKLHDKYSPQAGIDQDWGVAGHFMHKNFTANDQNVVLYDDKNHISKVFLGVDKVATRRGIGIGAGKILVIYTYGRPYRIVENFAFKRSDGDVVYEYKNPKAISEYLLFVINKKGYVEAVILSDQPADYIKLDQNNPNEEFLKNYLIYNNASVEGK